MVTQLDIDTFRQMLRARAFVGVMVGVSIAGIVWSDVALLSLGLNAGIWLAWFINKSAAIAEFRLVDDERLHQQDKEDHMTKK